MNYLRLASILALILFTACHLTAAEFFQLDVGSIDGISANGSTVVGSLSSDPGPSLWTEESGVTPIAPFLPGQDGVAYGTSGNGAIVVGTFFGSSTDKPFIWTADTGTEAIDLPEAFTNGQLGNLSDDGEFGGGTLFQADDEGPIPESWRAAYWTRKDGMQSLGTLPGHTSSSANFGGISADGMVVVGRVQKQVGESYVREAFMWTKASGMQGLGMIPDSGSSSAADISADGAVIVGTSVNRDHLSAINMRFDGHPTAERRISDYQKNQRLRRRWEQTAMVPSLLEAIPPMVSFAPWCGTLLTAHATCGKSS